MNDKRYQVFISSTFEDLKAERRAVQDVVISTGDFPVQMESFPAADEPQFAFIKSLIDMCDYYVLIIAGRYGAKAENDISYTEKEYQYAVSIGVPVLVMLHGNRGKIIADKTESTDEGKKCLDAFVEKVQSNRLRKTWVTLDSLKLAVREALDHAKATQPRVGWVRGDSVANVEALEELYEARKENEKFRKNLSELEIELVLPPIPKPEATVTIDLLPIASGKNGASVQTTWISVFHIFHSNFDCHFNDWGGENCYVIDKDDSCVSIGSAIAGEIESIDTEKSYKISKGTFDRLMNYYIELGLMNPAGAEKPFTAVAEKIARRHSISDDNSDTFKLIKGEIKTSLTNSSSIINDPIPF